MGDATCLESDCSGNPRSRGICQKHYDYYRRRGLLDDLYPRKTLEERFREKVDRDGPEPDYWPELGNCWIWTAYIDDRGYGRIGGGPAHNGEILYAHRLSYELNVGGIPEDLVTDHLCRVRHCVRPDHLEMVTDEENRLRGLRPPKILICWRGHAKTGANAYCAPGNEWPYCRECRRLAQVRRKARHAIPV